MTPNTMRIAPSNLSADFARRGEEVRAIEVAGGQPIWLEVDGGIRTDNIAGIAAAGLRGAPVFSMS